MMRLLFSVILLCACLAVYSANIRAQELFQQPVSPHKALEALRLDAANTSDPQAVLKLAKFLYNEKRVRSHREACRLFEDASARGSAEATAWLGNCYIYGRGVEKEDIIRGVNLIQLAAQADDPAGLQFLGLLFENGCGVPRDYARAAGLFSRAVSKGYAPAYARLGRLYMHGLGVKQNRRAAFQLFNQGAQLGDPLSQLRLGELAFNGKVGPQGEFLVRRSSSPNYEMALQLFSQSVAQGNMAAAFKIGQMYENQLGVAQDTKKAAAYYLLAAREGDQNAQLALGRLSEKLGPRGPLYAYAWYSIAIGLGNETAKTYLDTLRAKMKPDQVQQSEKLLARWKSNHFCYGCRNE